MTFKKLIALSILTAALCCSTELRAATAYTNWPATPEWVELTNHISWCYQEIQTRNLASGANLSTNSFAPTYVYPYWDYVRFAQAVDRIVTNFVCQTNASSAAFPDTFSSYFTNSTDGVYSNDFPVWTQEGLHQYAFGATNWTTNTILHSWMAVTNKDIQIQVQSAITNLMWTRRITSTHTNSLYTGALVTGEGLSYAAAQAAVSNAIRIPTYYHSPSSYIAYEAYLRVFNPNETTQQWMIFATRQYAQPYLPDCYTGAVASVSLYLGMITYRDTPYTAFFNFDLAGCWSSWPDIVADHIVPMADLGLHTQQLIVANYPFPASTNISPASYSNDWPVVTNDFVGEWGARATKAYWLIKWQFTNQPPTLTHRPAVEDSDSDRDDIVDPGVNLATVTTDTGTIVWRPEQDLPLVAIPLASTPIWYGGPPVHAYLAQGGTTNLPYHYLVPGVDDSDGPYQAYSLATRVLEAGTNIIGAPVKRVSLLRPRGNTVIFDFPWSGSAFSTLGYPIGINSNRTYVLRDQTDGDGSLRYDLQFASGVTHQFNGAITNIVGAGGLASSVTTNALPGGTVLFPATASDARYNVTLAWSKGVVSQVTYGSKDNSKFIVVAVSRFGAGNITGLAKSGDITDIGKANVSVSGSTINYSWGTVARSQSAPAGQARTVTLTTTATDCSPVVNETKFDVSDRLYNAKITSEVAGQNLVAETAVQYFDIAGRYANGILKKSKINTITFPDKSCTTYTYDGEIGYNCGWPLTETVLVSPVLTRKTEYGYTAADGDPVSVSNLVERPRSVTLKLNDTAVAKTLYSFQGACQATEQKCVTPSAAWGADGNLITTRILALGGLTNGLPISLVGPVVSSTWSYTLDGLSGGSFGSIGAITSTKSDNAGITVYRKDNAFGHATDMTVRKAAGTGQADFETFSAHAGAPDAFGRIPSMAYKDGTSETFDQYCIWGAKSITRRDKGTVTINTFNDYGVATSIEETAPARSTTVATDPLGLQTSVTVVQGPRSTTSTVRQDLLGRRLYHSDPLASQTWLYKDNGNGYWTITQQQDGLGDLVVDTFADGSVAKVYGAGAQKCVGYAWSVSGGNQPVLTATMLSSSGSALQESATVACNAFGQPVAVQQAGVSSAVSFDYRSGTALPWRATDESGVRSIVNFDNYIGVQQFGVKMDAAADLNASSSDQMFKFGYAVDVNGETDSAVTYETNGSATETPLCSMYASHDGKQATMGFAGQTKTVSVSDFTDAATFTVDTASSDGSSTHQAYAPSGQILAMNLKDAASGDNRQITVSLQDNAEGQVYTIVDSVSGSEVLTFNTAGQLVGDNASGSGGQNVSYGYLPGTYLPNLVKGGGKTWSCQYWPNGLPKVVSASGSPTASLVWDTQGRLHSMTLNQASNRSMQTIWNRNSQTGRLTNKTVNNSVVESYTWKPNGQPDTVTRATGTMQYFYGAGGRVSSIVDTPANGAAETIVVGQSRMGAIASRTISGGVGETYTPRVDGSISAIQVSGSGVVPDHTLSLPQNTLSGQPQGFVLTQGGSTRTASVLYSPAAQVTNLMDGLVSVAYRWTPGSISTGHVVNVAGTPFLTLACGWNPAMRLRTNIAWTAGGSVVRSFGLLRGPGTNQITGIVREDGSSRVIRYEDSGYLQSWRHIRAGGAVDYDRTWVYSYDEAGNLLSMGHDPTVAGGPPPMSPLCKQYATLNIRAASTFDVDDNNLHIVRRWNAVDLVGYAPTSATVTVNGFPARRDGQRFVVSIPLAPRTSATVTNLTVCSVVSGGASVEYYTTNLVPLTLPAYPETISSSMAGATVSDSVREYLYDSRNQLRRVTDQAGATAIRLQSVYDYYPDGRRARKTVTQWDGSAWQPYRTCQYIYQGWNLVREVVSNQTSVVTRDYSWGLDLAGEQSGQWGQEAGGIGGLLAITEVSGASTNVFLPVCDQVGTVHALVAAMTNNVLLATPAVVAEYEYTPFGELISADGPYKNSCPFGFSSKMRDPETGLVYYGRRFLEPRAGKWLTVDPAGEAGGLNLTVACNNDPVNAVDPLGLVSKKEAVDYLKDKVLDIFNSTGQNKERTIAVMSTMYVELRRNGWLDRRVDDSAMMLYVRMGSATHNSYGPAQITPSFAEAIIASDRTGKFDELKKLQKSNPGQFRAQTYQTIIERPEDIISSAFNQFTGQWDKAREKDGKIANIGRRIDILATLYNLGPSKSLPKANPKPGGSRLQLDGYDTPFHSFGEWAVIFSKSEEVKDILKVLDEKLKEKKPTATPGLPSPGVGP